MATGRIKVFRAIPGFTSLGPILRDFCKKPGGVITAFADSVLPLCQHSVPEDANVEILSFGELVRSFLLLSGEEALPIAQSGHLHEAVAFACGELDVDSPFFRSSKFPGFHEAVRKTLDELHHWGIHASVLGDLAPGAHSRLAAKLASLAAIDRTVDEILGSLGRQRHTNHLRACLDSIPELEGELTKLLVIAGSEESPLRMQWLRWVADQNIDVTVVMDRHAVDAPIFASVDRSIEHLGAVVKSQGSGNHLTQNLFADVPQGGPSLAVSITSASDPLAEVEWALRGCIGFGDLNQCGIFVRDIEGYAPLVESVARRFGIAIRVSRRAPLLTNSFARLTLAALKFCASNDVRTLNPILRSSYLGLSGPQQHGLQTQLRYCYAQRANQWSALEAFVLEHPEGNEWLNTLLEWRRKMLTGTMRLPEWFKLLKEFNRDENFPWFSLESKLGNMDERDRRALNQIERLLANHISINDVTVAGSANLVEFVGLCERLWTAGDVSIPSAPSGVVVTSDPYTIGDISYLQVLGMLEGVFPRRRTEDPILTDQERAEISGIRPGLPSLLDSKTKAQSERDEFYRVCSAAKKEIVFSYPLADDQKDNIPAFYLSEVERTDSTIQGKNYPRPVLAPEKQNCITTADVLLREATDGPRQAPLPVELVSEAVTSAVRPMPGKAFEPRVLRDALECPFRYVARHALKLKVKRQSERWGSLRKLPQVSQLLAKKDIEDGERSLIVALNAELDQLYAEVPDWEMQLLRSGGQRLIRDWLHREVISREVWPKNPDSLKTNVSFGSHGVRSEMPGGILLEGAIAGISKLGPYNVAHIFGNPPDDVKKLKDGQRLFLGLHMLAIHESGREVAVEIESAGSSRTLVVLGRQDSEPLPSNRADGLQVVDLATVDDVNLAKKEFYRATKEALKTAVANIFDVRVTPIKGDTCTWCDYGELCRRAQGFGEDDSPFGDDQEVENF